MLVFIDESGDAGFKTEKGSSPVFVAAMVIFQNSEAAVATERAIALSPARATHHGEFKFSKTRDEVRDEYFGAIRDCPFTVRAIVVQKDVIYSAQLKGNKESFYEFFVNLMIRHDNGQLDRARVVIDGSGDRTFRKNLGAAIRKKAGAEAVRSCKFSDSKNDALVQLADMCVGAIARSFREDRKDRSRWRQMIRARIENVWVFR